MAASQGERNVVGGPYFEDFEVGQIFDDAPSLTLTSGHAAVHQALVGDRLRLPLDAALSTAVTGHDQPLAHPNLVCDVAIGQSTGPSQRVRGNLFYRGLVLLRPVFIGDTLRTRTEVVGLKQNRAGSGSGLVALRVRTADQHGEPVLDFWRCPMIPMRDVDLATGHRDRFETIPEELDLAPIAASVPSQWCLDAFRTHLPGPHAGDLAPGAVYSIVGRDTVTSAPELARLTLNIAMTHTDASAGAHGRRLVYGGHTIGIAAAQATRAIPNLVTILAWRSCEHTGAVFEGDVLSTELTIVDVHLVGEDPRHDGGGLVDLRAVVTSEQGGERTPVLDWRFVGLMA
ncbi:MAG: MaoC family dehydratase [Actinomycetota bacterium]|nr:MaoC family dehydratase [Actinomycetota bacterium]